MVVPLYKQRQHYCALFCNGSGDRAEFATSAKVDRL